MIHLMVKGAHNLNLLVPLRALLEEASVTRAAQRVNMGQSSMSAALAKARDAFDDELLVRVGYDYELTPLARQLLRQVQVALPLIERVLVGDDGFDPSTAQGRVSVMATDYAVMRLQSALATVMDDAPGVDLDVVPVPERPSFEGESDLLGHDFLVAVPGVRIEGRNADLVTDDYVCLLDAANPALRDGQLSLETFAALPQAVAKFGRHHHTAADRRLRELGIERPQPSVTTTSYLSLPSIVAGTDLVAVLPRALADRLGPATGTVGVDAPFGPIEIDLKLWWHETHDADPCHTWFRTRLVEAWQSPPLAA